MRLTWKYLQEQAHPFTLTRVVPGEVDLVRRPGGRAWKLRYDQEQWSERDLMRALARSISRFLRLRDAGPTLFRLTEAHRWMTFAELEAEHHSRGMCISLVLHGLAEIERDADGGWGERVRATPGAWALWCEDFGRTT